MNFDQIKLWTALITPFNEDGSIDFSSLAALVDQQVKAGNGLLVLGSTGEALNLSNEERYRILDYVISLKPQAPIMVGVGGIHLESTLQWIKDLNRRQGLSAYLMVSPLYAKPGDEGQFQWFKALLDESKRPAMLYNVPGRTGGELSLSAVRRLSDHPQFWSIKEASGSPEKFAQYVDAASGKAVFSGDDALLPDYAPLGAKGLVSVASNLWPRPMANFVDQCLNGTLHNKEEWVECTKALFVASNPVPVKALMHECGMISTPLLRPPLHHEDMRNWERARKAVETMKQLN